MDPALQAVARTRSGSRTEVERQREVRGNRGGGHDTCVALVSREARCCSAVPVTVRCHLHDT